MKKTIAVINQKGGVGKTTISINLSGGLAINGNKPNFPPIYDDENRYLSEIKQFMN